MAKVETGKSLTELFQEIELDEIDLTSPLRATDTLIRLSYDDGDAILELRGAFTYGSGALPVSGTISGLRLIEDGEVEFSVSEMTLALKEFFAALAAANFDEKDLLERMLEGDDFFVGSGADDFIRGGKGKDHLNGRGGDDRLCGDEGSDELGGGDGRDDLAGGGGHDHMRGGRGNDLLRGERGDDRLEGGGGSDRLEGGGGRDRLIGGAGDDVLDSGRGRDYLVGGDGADTFVFGSALDSSKREQDKIRDFVSGVDRIDLSGIDADLAAAGDQAFAFIGRGKFSETAGELRFKDHKLLGDLDGDGRADFVVMVDHARALELADLIL